MQVDIPGFGNLTIKHLVLDFTGTLSVSGALISGVAERLSALASQVTIHVITADTFGKARSALEGLPVELTVMKGSSEDKFKADFVESLGAECVIAMGNGNNDRLMLGKAAVGVAVVEREGCSGAALSSADLMVTSILDGLDLLAVPLRLKAGLRF